MVSTAIVLAGGLGTRLRSLVSDVPKPMADVQGRPFLSYLLDYWISQGINHFILSVGYKHEVIIDYFGEFYHGASIEYSIEEKRLGTGGGFILSYEKYKSNKPFILLNGDTFFPVNLHLLSHFSLDRKADWCFCVFQTNEQDRYLKLAIRNDASYEIDFEGSNNSTFANGGVYLLDPKKLIFLEDLKGKHLSLEKEVLNHCIKNGHKIYGFISNAKFLDIGMPSDYQRASSVLSENNFLKVDQ
jgi:D-glycero-alpha-D-manno-heptose 1-phosphate guanylyltransferase